MKKNDVPNPWIAVRQEGVNSKNYKGAGSKNYKGAST